MKNRLPLPIATIKEIKNLIEQHNNLYIKNPLYNVLKNICEYDYNDAVKGLGYLRQDEPNLMDYDKHISYINSAKKRYDAI